MLAFWSVEQDKAIPCTKFYNHLAERGKDAGLVSIVFCDGGSKEDAVRAYLTDNPMPTAHVALDDGNTTLGAYAISGMPFVLLIDREGKVVYQGTPGFEKGQSWSGGPTFMDDAFKKLVGR